MRGMEMSAAMPEYARVRGSNQDLKEMINPVQ